MPLLVISFGLQYYDKAILGSASIFGIIKDLGSVEALSFLRLRLSLDRSCKS